MLGEWARSFITFIGGRLGGVGGNCEEGGLGSRAILDGMAVCIRGERIVLMGKLCLEKMGRQRREVFEPLGDAAREGYT